MVARNQPVTLAAMEALFETQPGAPLVIIGQPDIADAEIDNPIVVPKDAQLPDLAPLGRRGEGARTTFRQKTGRTTFRCSITRYHIMVGLGTMFIAIMAVAALLLWRKQAVSTRAGCSGSCC